MLRVIIERAGEIVRDGVYEHPLLSIGRDETNEIVLDDPIISAQHLVIKKDPDAGDFRLFDQSMNGTFVNGERIRTLRFRRPTVLKIADFQLTFIPVSRSGTVEVPLSGPQETTVVDEEIPQRDSMQTSPNAKIGMIPVANAELRVISRNGELRSLVFAENAMIGRGSDCDLQFDSRDISRRHCVIIATASGYTVRRLSSKNGVRVNDRDLGANEAMPLRDGDVVQVVDEEIVFLYPATRPAGRNEPNVPLEANPNLDLAIAARGCADPDITAVDVVGFLGVKTSQKFEDGMLRFLRSSRKILLDMGYLVGIDGTGIAALTRVIKQAEQAGVPFQVIRVTPRVSDLLNYSPLTQVLVSYVSVGEETAIRKLKRSVGMTV